MSEVMLIGDKFIRRTNPYALSKCACCSNLAATHVAGEEYKSLPRPGSSQGLVTIESCIGEKYLAKLAPKQETGYSHWRC